MAEQLKTVDYEQLQEIKSNLSDFNCMHPDHEEIIKPALIALEYLENILLLFIDKDNTDI